MTTSWRTVLGWCCLVKQNRKLLGSFLRHATIQRRLASDVFRCVIEEKSFLVPFSYKDNSSWLCAMLYCQNFSLLLNNAQKQIPVFGFIFWRHYVIWVMNNSFCRLDDREVERLSLTLRGRTSNGKRQKWNFCRLSLALWTAEWKYLYLWRIVGDIFVFLCD